MAIASLRTRPLIAVLSRVTLFGEGMRAAFEHIGNFQSLSASHVDTSAFVRALSPNPVSVGARLGIAVSPRYGGAAA